jgi:hypothetical protein
MAHFARLDELVWKAYTRLMFRSWKNLPRFMIISERNKQFVEFCFLITETVDLVKVYTIILNSFGVPIALQRQDRYLGPTLR